MDKQIFYFLSLLLALANQGSQELYYFSVYDLSEYKRHTLYQILDNKFIVAYKQHNPSLILPINYTETCNVHHFINES